MILDVAILTSCLISMSLFINGVSMGGKGKGSKGGSGSNRVDHMTIQEIEAEFDEIEEEWYRDEDNERQRARRDRVEDELKQRHEGENRDDSPEEEEEPEE